MTFEHFQRLVNSMFALDENGEAKERFQGVDVKALDPLVAAYVGDAFFTLFVRTRLLAYEQDKVRVLNEFGAEIVSAHRQSAAYAQIEPMLTDEERGFYRRGRNAKAHAPRKASVGEYRASTGFEALLGSLYLSGQIERLYELTEEAFSCIIKDIMKEKEDANLEGKSDDKG